MLIDSHTILNKKDNEEKKKLMNNLTTFEILII